MRVVFMGTPDFAVSSLKALAESKKHEIVAVVTQPDKPKGRGQKMLMSPVKEYALEQGFEVYQPQKVKTDEFVALLQEMNPDIIVVAAFGQFLPKSILEMPKYGCINVHASLLPKYRGAAPIHYALLNGETKSGVTIMQMDIGMDTGDMISKVEVEITEDTYMGELHDALALKGAELLITTMDDIEAGKAVREPQPEAEATYATLLTRAMEELDWTMDAECVHNKIRAFNPNPGSFTVLPDGKKLKIWQSKIVKDISAVPGTVVEANKKGFVVACGKDAVLITEVQPESKKRMPANVFVNGRGVAEGTVLGKAAE